MAAGPALHRTKWHHVNDAQIRKILDDPDGGTTVFDPWVDVPGIKTVGVGGEVKTSTLRGDNQLLDQVTILTSITVSLSYAKLSLDVLAIMLGSTVVDAGAAGAETAELTVLGDDEPGYWELQAITTGTDKVGGAGKLIFPKCIVSGMPDIGLAEEDYRIFSSSAACMPRLSDNAWFKAQAMNTYEAIEDAA
jgi:hypothetical protein